MWYINAVEYYVVIKRNTFESVLTRWMNLEPIIQSEVSQKEKDKYRILVHIYGTEEFICRAAVETQTYGHSGGGRRGGGGKGEERIGCMERVTWKLTFSSVQLLSHVRLFATP